MGKPGDGIEPHLLLGHQVLYGRPFGLGELDDFGGLVDSAQRAAQVWNGGVKYLSIQDQLHSYLLQGVHAQDDLVSQLMHRQEGAGQLFPGDHTGSGYAVV